MFSSLLQGSAAFLAGSFAGGIALFPGKFSVTVRIPFFDQGCATLCPGLATSFFRGLLLLFINAAVLIEVKLLKNFRQSSVAEAPLTAVFVLFFVLLSPSVSSRDPSSSSSQKDGSSGISCLAAIGSDNGLLTPR